MLRDLKQDAKVSPSCSSMRIKKWIVAKSDKKYSRTRDKTDEKMFKNAKHMLLIN